MSSGKTFAGNVQELLSQVSPREPVPSLDEAPILLSTLEGKSDNISSTMIMYAL